MEPEEQVAPQDQETVEVAEETTEETPEMTPEEIAELKRKAEVSSQNFERAKKAEADLKAARENLKTVPSDGLTNKDILFLAKADIHEDDLDEVLDYAKFKKIPVAEAYKHVKPILDTKAEERKTAQATHTKGGARSASKVSAEDLLRKAEQTGELPDSEEGLQEIFRARQARRAKQ